MKLGLITGCSRGIGLAILQSLLEKKKNYTIVGTSTTGRYPISNANFIGHQLDLANPASITSLKDKVSKMSFDFLINNAGVLLEKWDAAAINSSQLRQTFEVNLFGTIALTEAVFPLIKKGGHIINVTSSWGAFSEEGFDAYQPHYKMSKAALNMYTKLLSKRLENKEITVSSIDPGWTQTDMGGSTARRKPEEAALDFLTLLDSNVESGQFWHQGKIRAW